jgi:hypothetical protein
MVRHDATNGISIIHSEALPTKDKIRDDAWNAQQNLRIVLQSELPQLTFEN